MKQWYCCRLQHRIKSSIQISTLLSEEVVVERLTHLKLVNSYSVHIHYGTSGFSIITQHICGIQSPVFVIWTNTQLVSGGHNGAIILCNQCFLFCIKHRLYLTNNTTYPDRLYFSLKQVSETHVSKHRSIPQKTRPLPKLEMQKTTTLI